MALREGMRWQQCFLPCHYAVTTCCFFYRDGRNREKLGRECAPKSTYSRGQFLRDSAGSVRRRENLLTHAHPHSAATQNASPFSSGMSRLSHRSRQAVCLHSFSHLVGYAILPFAAKTSGALEAALSVEDIKGNIDKN